MRQPIMVPAGARGLAIAPGRNSRVQVTGDGDLVVVDGAGVPRTVLERGDATAVVWIEDGVTWAPVAQAFSFNGVAVVLAGREPRLALRIAEWCPPAAVAANCRVLSGLDAVAAALGLPVEADPQALAGLERRRVRDVLFSPAARPRRRGLTSALLVLGVGVLAFAAMVVGGPVAAVAVLAALAALAPTVGRLVRGGRDFLRLTTAPVPHGGRATYRSEVSPAAAPRHPELQLGRDLVVFNDGRSYEAWLPGPRAGGVARCLVGTDVVRLDDAAGTTLLALRSATDVCPDDASARRLAEACAHAGVAFETAPLEVGTGGAQPWWARSGSAAVSGWEVGLPFESATLQVQLVLALCLVGALEAAAWRPACLLLVAAVLAASLAVAWQRFRIWRWRRAVRRTSERHLANPAGIG